MTTVTNIFNHFDLTIHGQVKWNTEIKSNRCGVYVIALTDDRDKLITTEEPNFNDDAIKNWIELIKTSGKSLLVDETQATTHSIKQRLSQFWFPDETIVYIGRNGTNNKANFEKENKRILSNKIKLQQKTCRRTLA